MIDKGWELWDYAITVLFFPKSVWNKVKNNSNIYAAFYIFQSSLTLHHGSKQPWWPVIIILILEVTKLKFKKVAQNLITFLKTLLYLFIEKRREKEGEKHQCVVASCAPLLVTWPVTQTCALTGNWASDRLVRRPVPNPLSHTSHGKISLFWNNWKKKKEITDQKLYLNI